MNNLQIKRVYLGSDHAGYGQKQYMKSVLKELGCEFVDLGTNSFEAVDYPDFAALVCERVQKDSDSYGLLICGSGVGICIAANKFVGVRAGLVDRKELAYYAVAHDKCNVLCLSSRFTSFFDNVEIVKTFLHTKFEGGRHDQRIEKIQKLESGLKN